MTEQRLEWEKVLGVLRKNKSATLVEISALSGIGQEELKKIIETLETQKLVKVTKRGDPLNEIVTLREMAFAAGQTSI